MAVVVWRAIHRSSNYAVNIGTSINNHEHPNFETATDTTSDLLKVGRVRNSRSAATSRFYGILWYVPFCRLTARDTVKIFLSVKKMKSTADGGN